jgi:hypothetical protein
MLERTGSYIRIYIYLAQRCIGCSNGETMNLTQPYAHAVYYAAWSYHYYSVPTLAPHMLGGLAAVAAIMKRQWRSRSKIVAVGVIWILLSSVDKRHRYE